MVLPVEEGEEEEEEEEDHFLLFLRPQITNPLTFEQITGITALNAILQLLIPCVSECHSVCVQVWPR